VSPRMAAFKTVETLKTTAALAEHAATFSRPL
jgi:hypothetical protein